MSPAGFGLGSATPLQRIICKAADGLPLGELASMPLLANPEAYDADIRERATIAWALGDAALPTGKPPAEFYVVGPIRSGKSLFAAAAGVASSQRCDVSALGPGEVPRFSTVSLKLDLARVIYEHALGRVLASGPLRARLIGEATADTITLAHPTGRPIEIKTVAGSKAGGSLISRWSAGVVFDEFPRMAGAEAVVNFEHERDAVAGRLLPGAQIFGIGSPWAPFGPAYKLVQERWQKPTPHQVMIRAVGPAMNPAYWTPERCAELKARNLVAYRTDVLGEFADPVLSMFSADELKAATRNGPLELPYRPNHHYVVVIDPATRTHAWTLVVLTRVADEKRGSKLAVAYAHEWHAEPGRPLSPGRVLGEVAKIAECYGQKRVVSDQWSDHALRDLGYGHGLYVDSVPVTGANRVDMFESLRTLIVDGGIELPPVPQLRDDLLHVRKRVTQVGVAIDLPEVGRRHCDYAAVLALAASQPIPAPEPDAAPLPDGWEEWELEAAAKMERRLLGGEAGVAYEDALESEAID